MLDRLIEFSVKNKLTVGILTGLLFLYGSYSVTRLPLDAVPDVTNNQVTIITQNSNLAPYEMEKFITSPLELSMANLPGLIEIRSISKFGLSNVILVFKDDVDVYRARQLVMERLKELEADMPAELGRPTLAPVSTGLGEIYQYVIRPKNPNDTSYSLMDLRTIQDWIVRKKLLGTEGVADVSSFGGYVKEYQAKVKPSLLRATNVSMADLFDALEKGNGNTGGAYIEKEGTAFLIRGIGLAQSLEDIRNIVIKQNNGVPVFVKDVAEVEFGYTVRYGAMTMNGNGEVVGAVVLMRKGENASRVVANVKKRIEEIKKFLPDDLEIVAFIDREAFVSRAIRTVTKNLIEACLIVVFVIIIFLGDIKASLLTASVIPLSLLFAIILMNMVGVGGNLMSLGAIDFGLMVDPSIIIVESIVVALALGMQKYGKVEDQDIKDLIVIDSVKEVKKTVVYGGLIILIVYFPIMTLTGVEGKMFSPMAIAVSFAITGAIILAMTYVTMMSTLVLKPHNHEHKNWSDKFVDFLFKLYEPIMNFSFKYKYGVVIASVLVLYITIIVFGKMGGEFIPKLDEGDYNIEVRMPVGTSLSKSKEVSTNIQKEIIKRYPTEIKNIVSKIGTSEIPMDPMPLEAMDIIIGPTDKEEWKKIKSKQELTDSIDAVLQMFPGIIYSIQQPIENRFNDMLSGAKTDVVIKIFGDDLDKLDKTGKEIAAQIATCEGAKDIQVQKLVGLPQIMVKYDRRLLAYYGIKVDEVNKLIQTAFAGAKAGTIYEGERRFDLSVRLGKEERSNIQDIMNLQLNTAQGYMIPLREISSIKTEKGFAEISRENGQRRLNVGFNVRGRDVESIVNEAAKKIEKNVLLPHSYYLDYGGQFENLRMAKERLTLVVPISLLIIFIILFITMGTFGDSLLIFTAIPLSAVGGVFAIYLRGMPFSISAGIGFIALFGVAVLNGIMLIGHFKLLQGMHGFDSIHDRVSTGIKEKFRQVLMTSATAALGYLPMAMSTEAGAEVQKPLATVVIGGLITSTILTLVVLPVLYILFNDRKIRIKL
ncbi:MAG: CusA/CzcA family heavy metal efflux RND transporter [Bacteroidota bacterium]|nr:CusA/CzcA family heavy metal efflux RND transporter [Bacteroidota bacterium]